MPPAKLSESHRRIIVQMVASGKTETVIAERLGVGRVTVSKAIKKLYEQWEVRNRAQLVLVALRAGFIDVPAWSEEVGFTSPDSLIVRKEWLSVIRLISTGYTDPEVAEKLEISKQQVSNYVHRLGTELGLANKRAVVVAIACELVGVLEED